MVRLYRAGSALVEYSMTRQLMPVKSPSCDWSHIIAVALPSGHSKPYFQAKNWTATHHLSSQNEGVGLLAWGWVCLSGESSKLLRGFGALINVPVEGVSGEKSSRCIFVPSSTLWYFTCVNKCFLCMGKLRYIVGCEFNAKLPGWMVCCKKIYTQGR